LINQIIFEMRKSISSIINKIIEIVGKSNENNEKIRFKAKSKKLKNGPKSSTMTKNKNSEDNNKLNEIVKNKTRKNFGDRNRL